VGFDRIRMTQAARKHRVGTTRVRFVVDNPFVVVVQPADETHMNERWFYLGDDPSGVALEVGAIALGGTLLVVHVQPVYQRGRFIKVYELGRDLQTWV